MVKIGNNEEGFEEIDDGDEFEILEPLGFKLPIKNPKIITYFFNSKCKSESHNYLQYMCSMEKIKDKIRNNLITPDYLSDSFNFIIDFMVDKAGYITNIKVNGTNNQLCKKYNVQTTSNVTCYT